MFKFLKLLRNAGVVLSALLFNDATWACGYAITDASIEIIEHGVPVLLAPVELSLRAQSSLKKVHRGPSIASTDESCAAERKKLETIFERLVNGSKLEHFMQESVKPTLVVQCKGPDVLPVAYASAGKILKAPASLATLAATEDAAAAVLAHELAHLTLRHHERLARLADKGDALTLKDIRAVKNSHEKEADLTGLKLLVNAKYKYEDAIRHLRFVDQLAKKSGKYKAKKKVHDGAQERIDRLQAQAQSCGY